MADDEEDDEMYVVVELSGVIDAKVLDLAGKRCSILGVDTPEPVLKLGSYLFTGEYRDATGTCVLFEETEPAAESTSSSTESRNSSCRQKRQKLPKELRYFGKTEKRLYMSTSFLQQKAKTAEPGQEAAEPDREDSSAESQEGATGEAAETVRETDKKPDLENSPTEMVVDDS